MESKLILSLPTQKTSFVGDVNLNEFNKPELTDILFELTKTIKGHPFEFEAGTDNGLKRNFTMAVMGGRTYIPQLKKPEIIQLMVSFGSSPLNSIRVAKLCAPKYVEVWKKLVVNLNVGLDIVNSLIGSNLKIVETTGWNRKFLISALLWGAKFATSRRYYSDKIDPLQSYLYLDAKVRKQALLELFGEDAAFPKPVETLPEGAKIDNFEGELGRDLLFLQQLSQSTQILTTGGSFPNGKLKSVVKALPDLEFADEGRATAHKRNQLLATAFIALLMANEDKRKKVSTTDPGAFGKFVITVLPTVIRGTMVQPFVPYFQGFTKTSASDTRAHVIVDALGKLLKNTADGWYDLSGLQLQYLCANEGSDYSSSYTALLNPYQFTPTRFSRSKVEVAEGSDYVPNRIPDLWGDITWPFIQAYIRLMVATGLLEGAYVEGRKGLAYVRLTPLGKYSLGLARKYTPKTLDSDSDKIELDDRNLIITLGDEKSPYRLLFDQVGRKIGGRRYSVTAESIVKGTKTSSEAESMIKNLRSLVKAPKGSRWEEELNSAESRLNVSQVIEDHYQLYKLNMSAPGLMEFIATNEEISSIAIRAQRGYVLVAIYNASKFEKLLKDAGYHL